jgi:serine/threonine protein kinase
VSELLEGETLRARLAAAPLQARKAADFAAQIARGLAAAHEKGIVHRDLKPENLFVTRDNRVKILDFGLAKLTLPEKVEGAVTEMPTATGGTEPGVILGTLGYMSPEQVRGQAVDARSDIFSFGAVLYEMLTGRRAFRGETAADTLSAILMTEPQDISVAVQDAPPALDRIVRHCLEKDPESRFQSARDLAFDLESLSGISAPSPAAAEVLRYPKSRRLLLPAAILSVLAALGAGLVVGKRLARTSPPSYQQVTYHRGTLTTARFAPDGQTIVYSASWAGET